jgi:hypothetical protein
MKYHINPETGRANICRAQPGNCKYGPDAPHFDDKETAREFFKEFNNFQNVAESLKKKKKQKPRYPEYMNSEAMDELYERYPEAREFFQDEGRNCSIEIDLWVRQLQLQEEIGKVASEKGFEAARNLYKAFLEFQQIKDRRILNDADFSEMEKYLEDARKTPKLSIDKGVKYFAASYKKRKRKAQSYIKDIPEQEFDCGRMKPYEVLLPGSQASEKDMQRLSEMRKEASRELIKELLNPEGSIPPSRYEEIDNDRFTEVGSGAESLAFIDKKTGIVLKVPHDGNPAYEGESPFRDLLNTHSHVSEVLEDENSQEFLKTQNSEYLNTEEYIDYENETIVTTQPFMAQDRFSPFDLSMLDIDDSFEANGFSDTHRGNVSFDSKSKKIVLFDCLTWGF